MSEPDEDPLAPVLRLVRTGETPPLAWVVRWSVNGYDALAGAWIASDRWQTMFTLLGFDLSASMPPAAPPIVIQARFAQLRTCVQRELLGLCPEGDWYKKPRACLPCAVAIRTAMPLPPITLGALISEKTLPVDASP